MPSLFSFFRISTPGELQVDDEGGNALVFQALVRGGEEHAGPLVAAVGDEDLAAVDDEMVAVALVGGGDGGRVAAGVGFGEEEATDDLAGVQAGSHFFFCSSVPKV